MKHLQLPLQKIGDKIVNAVYIQARYSSDRHNQRAYNISLTFTV